MSTVSSNLYAEKVFAEHSLSLWHLDDPVDYLSLISEPQRGIASWTLSSGVTIGSSSISDPPTLPLGSVLNRIIFPTISANSTKTIILTSPILFSSSTINVSMESFAVSAYTYANGRVMSFGIGYSYTDSSTMKTVTISPSMVSVDNSSLFTWGLFSQTFAIPDNMSNVQIMFYASVTSGVTDISGYTFFINGITVGQWSEQFFTNSLGATQTLLPSLPTGISNSLYGVIAEPYGISENHGYYLIDQNSLCAVNSSGPLAYGSSSSTRLIGNPGRPSLIVPGRGFMNDAGQYRNLTIEMWLRVQTSSLKPERLFGPISSSDGLYVNDSFFILRVGNKSKSFFVGEWDRPMLVAVRISSTKASLVINGEELISLDIVPSEINFPSEFDANGASQDWIGFYANDDIFSVDVDCIGIFPYLVPNIMEKRRWVYGQAVENPDPLPGTIAGPIVAIDYPLSNYSKNYSYPDIGKWSNGIVENLSANNESLSLENLQLPTGVFSDKTEDRWMSDLRSSQTGDMPFLTLRPKSPVSQLPINTDTSWANTEGYLKFEKFNFSSQDTKAFYGLFSSTIGDSRNQTLFYLENSNTKESLEVSIKDSTVSYTLNTKDLSGQQVSDILYTSSSYTPGKFMVVGISIDDFVLNFGSVSTASGLKVLSFFGAMQNLSLYVGGKPSMSNTFSGNIFSIGLCSSRNLKKISNRFYSSGSNSGLAIPDQTGITVPVFDGGIQNTNTWTSYEDSGNSYFENIYSVSLSDDSQLFDGGTPYDEYVDTTRDFISSYTLRSKIFIDNFELDIATNGYWQDYVPLSYFAKYYNTGNGKAFGFDFLQFNIGYPRLENIVSGLYDIGGQSVKASISFQYLGDNPSVDPNIFIKNYLLPSGGVVYPSDDWQTSKYEVQDETIIYPPDGIDFKSLALVFHIEVLSGGKTEQPVNIRSIRVSSKALDSFLPNAIDTKYGVPIYPYIKAGEYLDYKGRNPVGIYRGSSPYLYQTATSGIRLKDFYGYSSERGIRIPINDSQSIDYSVSAMQMSIRYDDLYFQDKSIKVLEIESNAISVSNPKGTLIQIFLIGDGINGKRGMLYAVDGFTGTIMSGVTFYINGNISKNPIINLKSWTTLEMSFSQKIDFSASSGSINITGPLSVDNVMHYKPSANTNATSIAYNKWYNIRGDGTSPSWTYYKDLPASWNNVLFVSVANSSTISGSDLYKKYTGTDHIIVDTESIMRMHNAEYLFYENLVWKSSIITPV